MTIDENVKKEEKQQKGEEKDEKKMKTKIKRTKQQKYFVVHYKNMELKKKNLFDLCSILLILD